MRNRNDHYVSTNGYLTFKKVMAYDFPELKKDPYTSSDWKTTLNTKKFFLKNLFLDSNENAELDE